MNDSINKLLNKLVECVDSNKIAFNRVSVNKVYRIVDSKSVFYGLVLSVEHLSIENSIKVKLLGYESVLDNIVVNYLSPLVNEIRYYLDPDLVKVTEFDYDDYLYELLSDLSEKYNKMVELSDELSRLKSSVSNLDNKPTCLSDDLDSLCRLLRINSSTVTVIDDYYYVVFEKLFDISNIDDDTLLNYYLIDINSNDILDKTSVYTLISSNFKYSNLSDYFDRFGVSITNYEVRISNDKKSLVLKLVLRLSSDQRYSPVVIKALNDLETLGDSSDEYF